MLLYVSAVDILFCLCIFCKQFILFIYLFEIQQTYLLQKKIKYSEHKIVGWLKLKYYWLRYLTINRLTAGTNWRLVEVWAMNNLKWKIIVNYLKKIIISVLFSFALHFGGVFPWSKTCSKPLHRGTTKLVSSSGRVVNELKQTVKRSTEQIVYRRSVNFYVWCQGLRDEKELDANIRSSPISKVVDEASSNKEFKTYLQQVSITIEWIAFVSALNKNRIEAAIKTCFRIEPDWELDLSFL